MYDYSRQEKPNVYTQRKKPQNTPPPNHDLMKEQLLRTMRTGAIDMLYQQNRALQFTVPKGWSLSKIATHLKTSESDLKFFNHNKLKNWNGVEGFNAGEVIIYPKEREEIKQEEKTEPTPEDIISKAKEQYDKGNIDMIELGRTLIPYGRSHGAKIIEIMQSLPYIERDNLAYVISSNTPNFTLTQYDPALLIEMKETLGLITNTTSWSENGKQELRIEEALKMQNSLESRIEKLIIKDELTAKEIATIRPLIAQLEESKQAKYYLLIQEKVKYKNQRNNKSKATANDIANNDWMQGKENPLAADIMCNLTSIAMALETVGISNPSPDMQFEDYLEKHRLEKYGDEARRTESDTMINIVNDLGADAERIDIYSNDKNLITKKLKPLLEKGYGVALSAFSQDSGKGHIVRLQAIESEGLRLDDPYGDVSGKLAERESGNHGYKYGKTDNTNDNTDETGIGENNLWKWSDIKKTTIKYAIVINTL